MPKRKKTSGPGEEVAQDRVHLVGLDEEAVVAVQGGHGQAAGAGDAPGELLGLPGQEQAVGVDVDDKNTLHLLSLLFLILILSFFIITAPS